MTDKEKKKKISEVYEVHRLTENIKKCYNFYTADNDVIWYYDEQDGIWRDTGQHIIQSFITTLLHGDMRFRSRVVNEVVKKIRYSCRDSNITLGGPPHIIVCANGRIDMNTGTFHAHYKMDEHQITKIPAKYDPQATCPAFTKFLSEVVDTQEDRDAIIEMFGYTLFKENRYDIVPLLIGGGSNGKSTLLNVLTEMIGKENVTVNSLHDLSENRFATASLHGKLANVCAEQPATTISGSDKIKAITGRDMVRGEKKGQQSFEFHNYAKLWFSANQIPRSVDDSIAFYRRFRVIDFPHVFDATDPITDGNLITKLTTPQELSGILNLAVAGWQRLKRLGYLTGEKHSNDKRLDYIKRSNSVLYFALNFVEQWTHEGDGTGITVHDMYSWYNKVSHHIKIMPVGQRRFSRELKRYVPYAEVEKMRIGNDTEYVWTGCTIRIERLAEMETQNVMRGAP